MEKLVSPEYQEQLDLLASSLTERFRKEVQVIQVSERDYDDMGNYYEGTL